MKEKDKVKSSYLYVFQWEMGKFLHMKSQMNQQSGDKKQGAVRVTAESKCLNGCLSTENIHHINEKTSET